MNMWIYILCLVTSALCAWLLLRAFRRTQNRLLFWSGLCFCCMTLNNLALVVDVGVFPERDLIALRLIPAVLGICLLLFGLIWETKK